MEEHIMKQMICALLILGLITGVVGAQEITVVTEEFPPFSYTENGEITGASTEIVRATLAKAGIQANIRVYPWARAYWMASEQKNVLIYTLARTPEREELFKWIGPIVPPIRAALFKLKKRTDIVLTSLDDAKQYDIGVVKNDGGHQILLQYGFEDKKNLFPVTKGEQNIQKLLAERIDLFFSDSLFVMMKTKELGLPVEQIEEVFLAMEVENYMAFSEQTSDELVERVRTAFEQLKADGTVEAIIDTYFKPSE
jgi:polar amino acid transport system substrate-binding protein